MNLATVISQLKEGNHKTFKELVYKHTSKLMTVARIYTRNIEDAKDVLQDSFISIYQHIGQFQGNDEGALLAWMKKIVMNAGLAKYKRMRYTKENFSLDLAIEKSVEPLALANFDADELMNAIHKLPLKYKQVLGLYAIEGYSHKEIGEKLNIQTSTSRSTYSRAKVLLQKSMVTNNLFDRFQKLPTG